MNRATTDIQAGFAQACTFRGETYTFLNIALYEQRLQRIYKSTIQELKQAQIARFAKLKEEADLAIVHNVLHPKLPPIQTARLRPSETCFFLNRVEDRSRF